MSEALETADAVSQEPVAAEATDLDWDAPVEDFPSIEPVAEEGENEGNTEESMGEPEASSAEAPREKTPKEDSEAPREVSDSKEENQSREQESPKEDSEASKVVDINELPDDTLVKIKVDGELKEISLKEYKNGISGEKAIAKRFSEYDVKEKQFKAELDEVNSYVNTFAQKMQSGDPVSALEYLTQFTDIPAYEVKDMLIKSLLPEIERRQELMPEQLDLEKSQAKLQFEQQKAETEQKKFQAEQAKMELNAKIDSTRQTHNISQEDWDSAFKHLDSSLPASEAITIDTVKEYVLFSRAEDALSNVDSSLIEDKGIMDSFIKVQDQNPDFTKEDLIAIAKDAFGQVEKAQAKEELQEVVEKKQIDPANKVAAEAPQIQELDAEDWDEIL